jgi:four helix bundle protein
VFEHQKLEVYQRSLTVLELSDAVAKRLPKGRAELREQMDRASSSIVANIAEGAGEFSRKEKARFYRIARRSAIELAAWLEITTRRRDAHGPLVDSALSELGIVVRMLVKLIQSCER